MLQRVVRFVVGLIVASILWAYGGAAYNAVVARAAGPLLRLDQRFADARVTVSGENLLVTSPRRAFPTVQLPLAQLTYNLILLVALFASNVRPLRGANVRALLLSLIIVAAIHPIGVVVTAESTFSNRFDDWSEEQYGDLAAGAWLLSEMFYRLVGMFGVVFACWWLTSKPGDAPPAKPKPRAKKRR